MVVVMYHDQGHIPLKVKGFVYNKAEGHWDAVAGINVTLGLPSSGPPWITAPASAMREAAAPTS